MPSTFAKSCCRTDGNHRPASDKGGQGWLGGGQPREPCVVLHQVALNWLCKPGISCIENKVGLRFVQSHGAGSFDVGVLVHEIEDERCWSDKPFGRAAWISI
jgi:hypothetical protein